MKRTATKNYSNEDTQDAYEVLRDCIEDLLDDPELRDAIPTDIRQDAEDAMEKLDEIQSSRDSDDEYPGEAEDGFEDETDEEFESDDGYSELPTHEGHGDDEIGSDGDITSPEFDEELEGEIDHSDFGGDEQELEPDVYDLDALENDSFDRLDFDRDLI